MKVALLTLTQCALGAALALGKLAPRGPVAPVAACRGAVAMGLSPGDAVAVVGSGPVSYLTAQLAAKAGFKTTLFGDPRDLETARELVSADVAYLPIAGPDANSATIDAGAAAADALIVAFDRETAINEKALGVFTPDSGKLKHIAVMSRYLSGEGMGFFANAAKAAANKDVWAAPKAAVAGYQEMERGVRARASQLGAKFTIIRAGTLKAGAVGDSLSGGGGEPSFLDVKLYEFGQQDIVNWRLLYDCQALGVKLVRGDTLPGPGFTAALTATTETGGAGDSHRGAVAAALVEALRVEAAEDGDFSVGSEAGTKFPGPAEWAALFKAAA